MRVGIITERYPPTMKGGGEVSVSLLARGLKARGVDVRVLSFDGRGEGFHEGVPVKRLLPAESLHLPVEKGNLLAYPAIKEFSREVELVHGYNMRYYPATVAASGLLGLPAVLTMTTYGFYYPHHVPGLRDPSTLLGRIHQRLSDGAARRIITGGARALIVLSSAQKKIYEEAGYPEGKLRVIPNFLDPYFVHNPPEQERLDRRRILYVGRLSSEKGVDTLIRAYALVRSAHPDIELSIVGGGPLLEELRGLASLLGVLDSTNFAGKISYEEARRAYSGASIFVHPALWPEPFGRSILEAMASGLPVIASRAGSAPELVADTGLLFEPGDPEDLASRIDLVLEDSRLSLELSKAARQRALSEYSEDRVLEILLSLYEESRRAPGSAALSSRQRAAFPVSRAGRLRRVRHRCGELLDRTIVPPLERVMDAYYRAFRKSGSDGERILFMAFTRGIGDAVLLSPALNALRRDHPGSYIAMVSTPYVDGLVSHYRSVDRFIPFPVEHAGLGSTYRLLRELRSLRFDTAIDVLPDRSVLSALLSFLSGARRVAGFSVGLRSIFFSKRTSPVREGQHFADLVRNMVGDGGSGDRGPCVFESDLATDGEKKEAARALHGMRRPLFCVHPGSKGVREFRWPADSWVTLLNLLRERHDCGIVLIGTAREKGLCTYIQERTRGGALNLAGACSLGETAAVIGSSDLLLSIASGPLHMAVSMGVPAVYVAGGVDLVRWGAYGDTARHRAVLRDSGCRPWNCGSCPDRLGRCAAGVSPASLLDAVEEMLEGLNLAGLEKR